VSYARAKLCEAEAGARAREYLKVERGLEEGTWQRFQLGLNPQAVRDETERWGLNDGETTIFLPRGIVIPRYFRGRLQGIKIRRAREGEALAQYLQAEPGKAGKFASVSRSQHGLFGYETWLGFPDLLLVEGEWDCMLAWQEAGDLCDVGTLGSATQGLCAVQEEVELYTYRRVVVVYDGDAAGETGRRKFEGITRAQSASPPAHSINAPAHDLTDYWKQGGDLRGWVRQVVAGRQPAGFEGDPLVAGPRTRL
jgi:hypothetical protein